MWLINWYPPTAIRAAASGLAVHPGSGQTKAGRDAVERQPREDLARVAVVRAAIEGQRDPLDCRVAAIDHGGFGTAQQDRPGIHPTGDTARPDLEPVPGSRHESVTGVPFGSQVRIGSEAPGPVRIFSPDDEETTPVTPERPTASTSSIIPIRRRVRRYAVATAADAPEEILAAKRGPVSLQVSQEWASRI